MDKISPTDDTHCTYKMYVVLRYMPHALATRRSADQDWGLFRNHIFPALGDVPLREITRSDIAGLIDAKKQSGLMSSTCNRILAKIKATYSYAVDCELIDSSKNPSRLVKPFREPPHRDRFLTQAEGQRLLREVASSSSPMLKFIIPFLLLTGARKGEAIQAEWSHVNTQTRTWTVPLSKNGRPRFITLSNGALQILDAVKAFTSDKIGNNRYIFPNIATGKPYRQIYHPWDIVRQRAGLDDVRIHDLRHSFASALINQGMTLYDVKELLGHSNITTTQRYAHLSKDRLVEAASKAELYINTA